MWRRVQIEWFLLRRKLARSRRWPNVTGDNFPMFPMVAVRLFAAKPTTR